MILACIQIGLLSIFGLKLLANVMMAFAAIDRRRKNPDSSTSLMPFEILLIPVPIVLAIFVDRPGWWWHTGKLTAILLTTLILSYLFFFIVSGLGQKSRTAAP